MNTFTLKDFERLSWSPVAKAKYLKTLDFSVRMDIDDESLEPREYIFAFNKDTHDWSLRFGFIDCRGKSHEEAIQELRDHFQEIIDA